MPSEGPAAKLADWPKPTSASISSQGSAAETVNVGDHIDNAESADPTATHVRVSVVAIMKKLLAVADTLDDVDAALTRLEEESPGLKADLAMIRERLDSIGGLSRARA